jgi:CSLREA domain-containing protein
MPVLRTLLVGAALLGAGAPAALAAPTASFDVSPAQPHPGETVTLTSTSSSSAQIFDWSWDLDGDGNYGDAKGEVVTTSFDSAGDRELGLQVTDSNKETATARKTIKVLLPEPPFAVSNQTPKAGDHVTFDATALGKAHGGAKDFRWDLDGDGSVERDTRLSPGVGITYARPGAILVGLLIGYADGTSERFDGALRVDPGAVPAGCDAAYCHVDFPFTPSGGDDCTTTLDLGLVHAEADCFRARGSRFVATGRIRLNGLDLYTAGAGDILVDPAAGSVDIPGLVTLQYAEFTLAILHDLHWTGLEGTDGEAVMPNILPGPTTAVEGFGITGRLGVTFHDGSATFDAHVELPDSIGGVDAQLRLTASAEHPATLDELHISLPAGQIFSALPIDHLSLDYEAAANAWGGDVGVNIGDYTVAAGIGFHLLPETGLDSLSASIGGLNVSIYAGVFLDEIRFDYASTPAPTLGGGITLTYGPEYRDTSLISADGNFHLTFSDPAVIHLDGEAAVLAQKIATIDARYSLDGNFTFDAAVRIGVNPFGPHRVPYWEDSEPLPPARISAEVHGWADGPSRTFSAAGNGDACLGICIGGNVLVSSVGTVGCGHLGGANVGAGYTWITQRYDWLAGACDLGRWAVPRPGRARVAAAQASLTLPPGLPVAAFRVKGTGGAPHVTVTGPGGERVLTPAGSGGEKTASSLVAVDESTSTTYVAVAKPSGGTWRIVADPGSAPIAAAGEARALPPVSVHARVSGRGSRRTLRYTLEPHPGQKVTFAERAAGLAHVIGVAGGRRGKLRFVPGQGPAGTRRVVAQVTQGGLPRLERVVARYRAPGPRRLARPRGIKFVRASGGLAGEVACSQGRARLRGARDDREPPARAVPGWREAAEREACSRAAARPGGGEDHGARRRAPSGPHRPRGGAREAAQRRLTGLASPGRVARMGHHRMVPALAAAALLLFAPGALAATFTVDATTDEPDATAGTGPCATSGGKCTLRAAIQSANAATPQADTINFSIPGGGVQTIALMSALPATTDALTIDATTQPGWVANPNNGFTAGGVAAQLKIVIDHNQNAGLSFASPTTLKGLVISDTSTDAVTVNAGGGGSQIEGNFIGTNATGTAQAAEPNRGAGVVVNGANGVHIGGSSPAQRNVISGNGDPINTTFGTTPPYGIRVKAGEQTAISGNLIGTSADGLTAVPNALSGVKLGLEGSAAGSTVTGNLLSGNGVSPGNAFGVQVVLAGADIKIQGNRIGTDLAGTGAIPNNFDGVDLLNDVGVLVGGHASGEGNLVSGNARYGISVNNPDAVIEGNLVGTNALGTAELGNGNNGINVNGQTGTRIGHSNVLGRNVISGNGGSGIVFDQAGGSNSTVQDNYIGTNKAGASELHNNGAGIIVHGGSGILFGGGLFDHANGGLGNLISGNVGSGLVLNQPEGPTGASNNTISGNRIGTDTGGTADIGNGGAGISIVAGSDNLVGGPGLGAGNTIAFNHDRGIQLDVGNTDTNFATGNTFRANRIFLNTGLTADPALGLGIDLPPAGITANDSGDADTGSNGLQNFPLIHSSTSGTNTTIAGTLQSAANTTYVVEFFRNAACDPSGNGEGEEPIGTKTVTTDGVGYVLFSETVAPVVSGSQSVTATATAPDGSTSEFSPCRLGGTAEEPQPRPAEPVTPTQTQTQTQPQPTPTTTTPTTPTTPNPPPPKPRKCRDKKPPFTTLKRAGVDETGSTLELKGRSRDRKGCASGVRKVVVSLARVNGRTGVNCRFIRRPDRYLLTGRKNCREPTLFKAKGTKRWKFTFGLHLLPGDYRVQARGFDKAGNKETPKKRQNIVFFTVG